MTDQHTYQAVDVPVRGGDLRVGLWEPAVGSADDASPATVVVIHGVTASHRAWVTVAQMLPGERIVAPDLRGRGRSNRLPGPYGLAQHADDVAATLDFLGIASAVVVGHSMGGFVATALNARHPDRVRSLVLVDGGLPLMAPLDLGLAARRLQMTFPDYESYRELWRAHPAFAADWGAVVMDYADYDLDGVPGGLRPATAVEALEQDSADQLKDEQVRSALRRLPEKTPFLRAPRGFVNDEPGIYPPEWVDQVRQQFPALDVREVPGVNHYTIVMNEVGATAVVSAIREAIMS
jgi:pimeloyl-ACP methyl ester carboxylesterase